MRALGFRCVRYPHLSALSAWRRARICGPRLSARRRAHAVRSLQGV